MGDVRDNVWAFPLIGGIIALIAFLTPAAYLSSYSGSINIWMWGLFSITIYGYGSNTTFTQDPGELLVSILCSLIVLISIIITISKGNQARKFGEESGWLAPPILTMGGTIGWIVGMEIISQSYGISLWSMVNPGFGVIGMFLGSIVSIIGHGVLVKVPKRPAEVIVPMKEQFMRPSISQPGELATESGIPSVKFCPMCGDKLIRLDQKFCSNCGFEIKSAPEAVPQNQVIKPLTVPPETKEEMGIKEDCPNCELSRKLKREECIWCGKTF